MSREGFSGLTRAETRALFDRFPKKLREKLTMRDMCMLLEWEDNAYCRGRDAADEAAAELEQQWGLSKDSTKGQA